MAGFFFFLSHITFLLVLLLSNLQRIKTIQEGYHDKSVSEVELFFCNVKEFGNFDTRVV